MQPTGQRIRSELTLAAARLVCRRKPQRARASTHHEVAAEALRDLGAALVIESLDGTPARLLLLHILQARPSQLGLDEERDRVWRCLLRAR